MGAQVNIDEDANGSADESLSGRNEYDPADNDRAPDDSVALSFGETDKELANGPPMTSSCQTCLIQQPIQALMGVHWTAHIQGGAVQRNTT